MTSTRTSSTTPATRQLWDRLAQLPLAIDSIRCQQLELEGATSFTRLTTEIELEGAGSVGRGEDPAYSTDCQRALPAHFEALPLTGSWTLGSFAEHLDTLQVSPGEQWDDHPNFHRWAIESAALDLALRQTGQSLADVAHRELRPLRFCVSTGLGSPPSTTKLHDWLESWPQIEFKLDASREWDDALVAELAQTGAVRVVDIKGMYEGDWIDNTPDPELYARVAQGLPGVYIEDPKLRDDTRAALGDDGLRRVTWDAPLHSLADLLDAPHPPAAANIKPSRFGSVRELLLVIAYCEEHELPMYAGGQFELGYGRTQAQVLASLFYAESANDIAPASWHTARPGADVPRSPLSLPAGPGFGFEA